MNTIVWIMVMYGSGSNIVTGAEFTSQEKCERAVLAIKQSADDKLTLGAIRKPWCVRIEK